MGMANGIPQLPGVLDAPGSDVSSVRCGRLLTRAVRVDAMHPKSAGTFGSLSRSMRGHPRRFQATCADPLLSSSIFVNDT